MIEIISQLLFATEKSISLCVLQYKLGNPSKKPNELTTWIW